MELPIGSIIGWKTESIPAGWAICDGTLGTPDMVDKFVFGASVDGDIGVTGGVLTHGHTNPDTDTRLAHSHGGGVSGDSSGSGSVIIVGGSGTSIAGNHSHSISMNIASANAHLHTLADPAYANNLPPHIKFYFIKRIS